MSNFSAGMFTFVLVAGRKYIIRAVVGIAVVIAGVTTHLLSEHRMRPTEDQARNYPAFRTEMVALCASDENLSSAACSCMADNAEAHKPLPEWQGLPDFYGDVPVTLSAVKKVTDAQLQDAFYKRDDWMFYTAVDDLYSADELSYEAAEGILEKRTMGASLKIASGCGVSKRLKDMDDDLWVMTEDVQEAMSRIHAVTRLRHTLGLIQNPNRQDPNPDFDDETVNVVALLRR